MSNINWRSIKEVGLPTNQNLKYLVTDGTDISTTTISYTTYYSTKNVKFDCWSGDDNTYEDNSCCSGTRIFDLVPTHWCPINELNLPIINT